MCFFFQAEDGIRDLVRSRGLGDVYKRQLQVTVNNDPLPLIGWSEAELQNALDLAKGTGNVDPAALDLVAKFAPFLANLDLTIYMEFPLAKGAEAIQPATSK